MLEAAAAQLRDGELVLVGVGLPGKAATLAKRTHAPNLALVYESGAIGSVPAEPPLSIGDPTLFIDALGAISVADVFSYVIEGGLIDTAFVGAAEVDRTAQLNSTSIGPYEEPKARLPGSGGACEIVEFARRVLVLIPLEARRFPPEVAFRTSAPGDSTEVIVVTDRCLLRRPAGAEELQLDELFPGTSVDDVREAVGWPLQLSEHLEQVSVGVTDDA